MNHPQTLAADPKRSAFVAAHAGSGKTKTLVERVARLLLHDARPEAILCVTYTKAAAAEMQRRLYQRLGSWAVMEDAALACELAGLGEVADDLAKARRLFARALETPGGLKIQTLHAFCEKLLRRFPLEAGVSPGFKVLEDAAAAEVSAQARDALALYVLGHPDGEIAAAYAHFAVELDIAAFEGLLKTFETERGAIAAYLARHGDLQGAAADVWRVCDFEDEPLDPNAVEAEAAAACDWARWRESAQHLIASGKPSDAALGQAMAALAEVGTCSFAQAWRLFSTDKGEPLKRLGTQGLAAGVLDHLRDEQTRLHAACKRAKAARVARDSVHALALAHAYSAFYEAEKARRGALDFPDLIGRTRRLLTERADAAWVLYKLDGGIDHVLLDEAQDTSPDQWAIIEALTAEFFVGDGARAGLTRTLFAVGDEKQSIYSFQGADPDQLLIQTRAYIDRTEAGGFEFEVVPLLESWRSTPEVLSFVDRVFADPAVHAAVRPPVGLDVIAHIAVRPPGFGAVDFWPIVKDEPHEPPDAWDAPLDLTPPETARKRLARRIAEEVRAITSSQAVVDKESGALRPAKAGDVIVLVRRRDALFEEIIRALKKAGLPVAGADRLKLSDHVVFQDVLSLFRFCLFPADDLTLAELLRSPFCDVDEQGLYGLAYGRDGSLWRALNEQSGARRDWDYALAFLGWARRESRRRAPFDLFGRVLSRLDAEGRSMRQRILTRLGREAEDALDEIGAEILAAEGRGVHDLERLTAALERADIQVKRELESEAKAGHGGEVRVMTVHGAKGLEAPIVILPDTTGKPPPNRGALLKTEAGGFLFAPRKPDDCEASADARAWAEEKTAHEQLRLLYVALTRARDRVIVAGRLSARDKAAPPASWYALIEATFARPSIAAGARTVGAGEASIRRFGVDPHLSPPLQRTLDIAAAEPSWLRAFAAPEAVQRYASPSTYGRARQGAAPSPLAESGGLGRFRRGDLIHRLLQILPDLEPSTRAEGSRRLLLKERDLTEDQRREMTAAALGVLDDPLFADVFGPGSRAEAAVAGSAPDLPPSRKVSGRVDRMVVTPTRVLVVDFKSNRPSPDRIEEADAAYLTQMAIYVAVLRAIFPGRAVEAALVWTDGPKLMPIPENLISRALATIAESD
jgi:ATP-dependent helicase/nuclease subunit A